MKAVIEIYYCDICGGQVASGPFSLDSPNQLPIGYGASDSRSGWQTFIYSDNRQCVACEHCSRILKSAIDNKIISIHADVSMLVKEKDLIND